MTSRPDEAWHIDTTVIRLIDGTKAYVHAAIDNFSRRILAFRVGASFDIGNAVGLLLEAASQAVAPRRDGEPPMLVVDGGSENFNGRVDELVTSGILRRVLAQTDITFSNSMIEAFWRTLKHQWLFLNTLDTVEAVRRYVTFYVTARDGAPVRRRRMGAMLGQGEVRGAPGPGRRSLAACMPGAVPLRLGGPPVLRQ